MKNCFWTRLVVVCCALPLLLTSCTDPLEVGADLLNEDRAQVGFTDTFQLKTFTIVGDSVSAFSPGINAISNFLFGRTEDAYFGIAEAGFYIEPLITRDLSGDPIPAVPEGVDPSSIVIDSVVLVLPFDSSGIYGDINGQFGVEVYRVTEAIEPVPFDDEGNESFFSNIFYDVDPTPLATASFRPNFFDTLFIKDVINNSDTTTLRAPHIRIPLDNAFAEEFFEQPTEDSIFLRNEKLLEFFRGLYVKPTGVSPGMLNMPLNRTWPGVYFYYHTADDTLSYSLEVGGVGRRVSTYVHDYEGYVAGDYLANPDNNDSLILLQGMQGLLTGFEVPGLDNFGQKVINKAELELTVAMPADYDLTFHPPAEQIVALRRTLEGEFIVIGDVSVVPENLELYFGGQPEEQDDGMIKYTLNMSIHMQYVLDGSEPEEIYLAVSPRRGNASRVILQGPGAVENPPILKVSFTDL